MGILLLSMILSANAAELEPITLDAIPGFIREIDVYAVKETADAVAGKSSGRIRAWAKELEKGLLPLGERAVPIIVTTYSDVKSEGLKSQLLHILGLIGDEKAVPLLLSAGLEQKDYMTDGVIDALARIGTEQALTALLEIDAKAPADSTVFHSCYVAVQKEWKKSAGLPVFVSVWEKAAQETEAENLKSIHALTIAGVGLRKFPAETKKHMPKLEKIIETAKDKEVRAGMLQVLGKVDPERAKKYPDFKPGPDPDAPIKNFPGEK